MSPRIAFITDTLGYPEGGGHAWVSLNWAIGLRAAGAHVSWIEVASAKGSEDALAKNLAALRQRLERYGFTDLVIHSTRDPRPAALRDVPDLDAAADADLLLCMRYGIPDEIVSRFRRSAMIDIDPGLLQTWLHDGDL